MKPLHIGLLMVGAAIAGGLAVRMTAPPAFPTAPPHAVAAAAPAPAPNAEPLVVPAVAPRPYVPPAKPPGVPEVNTAAPPPVYSEPPHMSKRISAKRTPFPSAKPDPVEMAHAQPVQLPGLYQKPAEPVPQAAPPPQAAEPTVEQVEQPEPPRRVTVEPGTTIAVRMLETLSSDRLSPGDTFSATLAEPLVIDGLIVAERGARADGRVVGALRPSRINGRSEIELALAHIMTADGQRVAISTEPWSKTGAASGATQAAEVGGGAALGAVIGAIAGGGKGAAIGAAIGSGAGLGTAVATKAKPVTVPAEAVIRFRVNSRLTITERRL